MKNKVVLSITILTLLSKVFGFVRDMVLAYYFGASTVSDVFMLSNTIPEFIFSFVIQAITVGYIPIFSDILLHKGKDEADLFTNKLLTCSYILCSFVVILVNIFPEIIINIFGTGFDPETTKLAVSFIRITIILMYFKLSISVYSAYAQANDEFLRPAMNGIIYDIVLILFIWISAIAHNNIILAVGLVFAGIMQVVLFLPFLRKKGFQNHFILNCYDENIKKVIKLFIPVSIGVGINQVNILVDRTLASTLVVGGITMLNYANKITFIMDNVISMSIVSVLYPSLSKFYSLNDIDNFKKNLTYGLVNIMIFIIPFTFGNIIFSKEIVRVLFGHGAFDNKAVFLTSEVMQLYSLSMIAVSFRALLTRAYYSIHDVSTPVRNSCISLVINIILNIILSKFIGLKGLALATSISSIVCCLLLMFSLKRKISLLDYDDVFINFLKILISSLIMGCCMIVSYNLFLKFINYFMAMIFSTFIGIITYLLFAYLLRVENFRMLIHTLIRRKI